MTQDEREGSQQPKDVPQEDDITKDLVRSAQVIDHAIAHLQQEEKQSTIAIASACLGGALSLLAREMDKDLILRILKTAEDNVRSGEVHASVAEDSKDISGS